MGYRLLRGGEIRNVEPCVSLCRAETYASYVIVGLTLMFLRNSACPLAHSDRVCPYDKLSLITVNSEVPMAKILVIDDEEGIRNLLDTLLDRKGYDVILADNGQKGLEVFRRARPDVVILDLKMPGMDGLTVLQQIRHLDPTQPVIILTGAGTPEMEQQVMALGVTDFVEKEFSLHGLGDSLKRLLATPMKTSV